MPDRAMTDHRAPATRAVFPGSFDPLTVAHVAIADAVHRQRGADRVDLAISVQALEKEGRAHQSVAARVAAIEDHAGERPWLGATVTEAQLLVDIADGYHLLVVGADKWHQLHDPRFYGGSAAARDRAIDRLPPLAIVPRGDVDLPDAVTGLLLDLPAEYRRVSSSAVRDGRDDWRA